LSADRNALIYSSLSTISMTSGKSIESRKIISCVSFIV
jgi:hypothetical protein